MKKNFIKNILTFVTLFFILFTIQSSLFKRLSSIKKQAIPLRGYQTTPTTKSILLKKNYTIGISHFFKRFMTEIRSMYQKKSLKKVTTPPTVVLKTEKRPLLESIKIEIDLTAPISTQLDYYKEIYKNIPLERIDLVLKTKSNSKKFIFHLEDDSYKAPKIFENLKILLPRLSEKELEQIIDKNNEVQITSYWLVLGQAFYRH